jgi:hypothetical protein
VGQERGRRLRVEAFTGPPGWGKTTALLRESEREPGATGFVQEAEGRSAPLRGADQYWLRFLPGGERLLFATRLTVGCPPYEFHDEGMEAARRWARSLPQRPPLVVMDEFGLLEAGGHGHMELWPLVRHAQPARVLLGIREGTAAKLEELMEVSILLRDPRAVL